MFLCYFLSNEDTEIRLTLRGLDTHVSGETERGKYVPIQPPCIPSMQHTTNRQLAMCFCIIIKYANV